MYKTLNGWTRAQMIEAIMQGNNGKVATSLPRIGKHDSCVYRTADGNKCAVGCFIPDDLYHPSCEGAGAIWLLSNYPGLASYMPLDPWPLAQMQQVHDKALYCAITDVRPQIVAWILENVEG